jgi:hypothetical protein
MLLIGTEFMAAPVIQSTLNALRQHPNVQTDLRTKFFQISDLAMTPMDALDALPGARQ